MQSRPSIPFLAFALALGGQAANAEPAYLDDRSTPRALVHSLYNAINRQEYARAYAYFDIPPAETLNAYEAGFSDTASVEVLTGIAGADGAAGSIFYAIPTAIRATGTDGEEHVFAGCYKLIFVQPAPQTTPYKPLMIESGKLSPAKGSLEEALPISCGDKAMPEQVLQERATRAFETTYGQTCWTTQTGNEQDPESHLIRYKLEHDSDDMPEREARLYRFLCDRGAYNESDVYFLVHEHEEALPVRFVIPDFEIRYADEGSRERVSQINVIGYSTEELLANSEFDPESLTLSSHAKWRGVGDASSSGTWLFRSGAFSLVRYEVDASYDGEINPETLLDYETGP